MVEKLLKKVNLTQYENQIKNRLEKNNLTFGNKIQITELKILSVIDDLKNDKNNFIECSFCQEKFSIIHLQKIDNNDLCENCIDENYRNCYSCGDYIYNENVNYFNDENYCKECYFKARQVEYNTHVIENPLLKKLSELKDIDLFEVEFKIENNYYTIECYAGKSFRLGSFSANTWLDIGNLKKSLLKAIDYNLKNNSDKITAIYLKDNNNKIIE